MINNLINDLKNMNLKGDEVILVHSSCKAIGYDANLIIDSLMEYFKKEPYLFLLILGKLLMKKILFLILKWNLI